jgi:D-serine dehydratase
MSQISASPAAEAVRQGQPCLWLNPGRLAVAQAFARLQMDRRPMQAASDRLARFAPVLARLFPELAATGGIIESPLLPAPGLQAAVDPDHAFGRLMIKADHLLPVAGSVKARGGVHEVLEFAERLALQAGLVAPGGEYSSLATATARNLFSRYTVAVGSTGNLGLSIGITAAALGFQAVVHMSQDAKQWKKDLLRSHGVTVIEHRGDYALAVAAGRETAAKEASVYFVDDERSDSLFFGYSVAAQRLARQLAASGVAVDDEHPLFVYLPCGVGGAPGGITFGLKQVFGDAVHCFFAEPVASPCMLVALMAPEGEVPSVYDWGLDNVTEADGLAVPSASEKVARLMRPLLSGIYTLDDETLLASLHQLHAAEALHVEPSAAAGLVGPALLQGAAGQLYLDAVGRTGRMAQATHVIWTTGGRLVPEADFQHFLERGRQAAAARPPMAPR